jgi:cellulose biosynthesis protein BcsQ
MRKIVFFNTKGGTGKSTVCFNYGWYLAEYCKKRILFLDFDPQISLTRSFLKISSIPENKCSENLIVSFIKKDEINIVGMLINAFEKRRKTSESIVNRLNQNYSKDFHVIQQKIRYLSNYQPSIVHNSEPVFLTYPNSPASLDLLDAFGELD